MIKIKLIYLVFSLVFILFLSNCYTPHHFNKTHNKYVLDSFDITLPEYEILNDDFKRILDSALIDIETLKRLENTKQLIIPYYIRIDFRRNDKLYELVVKVHNSYSLNFSPPINLNSLPYYNIGFGGLIYKGVFVNLTGYWGNLVVSKKNANKGKSIFKSLNREITFRAFGYHNLNNFWKVTIPIKIYCEYYFDKEKQLWIKR